MAVAVERAEKAKVEAPVLEFDAYALAFHLAVEWPNDWFPAASNSAMEEDAGSAVRPEPMESYERDMLLYAHRDEPPFRTRVVSVPDALATLTVRFPAEL